MNTVFARALVTLTLVTLPASALASTKSAAKADPAKHEAKGDKGDKPGNAKHSHAHAHESLAKREHSSSKAKHHSAKTKGGKDQKRVAAAASESSASKAP